MIVGIPTLNRYDLLRELLHSLDRGSLKPEKVYVVDNGGKYEYVETSFPVIIIAPEENLGVAKSWNELILAAGQDIVISNDDLEFGVDTLEKFSEADGDLVYCKSISELNMFSLYLIRTSCIEKVGLFDENFYPAYFEDNDYYFRMKIAGIKLGSIHTDIKHHGSSTIKRYNQTEMYMHHVNFRKNQDYYIQKWGGMPEKERFFTAFNK